MKKEKIIKIIPILVIVIIVITFTLLLNMKSKINEKAKQELTEKKQSVNNVIEGN